MTQTQYFNKIFSEYDLGKIDKICKISIGLINETYLVEAGADKFILQKLNPIFKKEAILDFSAVSGHLEKKEMMCQKILPTSDGSLFVEADREVWRVLSFIPGIVFTKTNSPEMVYEAGKILGKFHFAVGDFGYEFKHKRPMHHATDIFVAKLEKLSKSVSDKDFKRLAEGILSNIKNLYLPKTLRKTVTHGDPKISNIIFQSGKAVALIDLDDCGREHNALIELGDAFRSWCGSAEDDKNNHFDMEKFKAGLNGYFDGSKNFLNKDEVRLIPQAVKLITLELAMRFLTDYIEDNYFGWDKMRYQSRRAHNLARANGQLALFQDLEAKSAELVRLR